MAGDVPSDPKCTLLGGKKFYDNKIVCKSQHSPSRGFSAYRADTLHIQRLRNAPVSSRDERPFMNPRCSRCRAFPCARDACIPFSLHAESIVPCQTCSRPGKLGRSKTRVSLTCIAHTRTATSGN
jgi:hypothetical protein